MKKLLVLCVLISAGAVNIFAQAGLSSITGSVHDASGAVVPAATVIVANESKGIRRELESNAAGVFSAPALTPSSGYSVEVSKAGFVKYSAKGISLNVGQIVDLSVALTVSTTATTVDVTADAPLIESDKSGVTDVVDQDKIDNLPIN